MHPTARKMAQQVPNQPFDDGGNNLNQPQQQPTQELAAPFTVLLRGSVTTHTTIDQSDIAFMPNFALADSDSDSNSSCG